MTLVFDSGALIALERNDRAMPRLDPIELLGMAAVGHREDADRIGAKQQIGIERLHRL